MKKKIVLLMAMLASVVLLTIGLTIGAAADGEVATNTRTNATYTSIADAISEASDGDTIDVIANTTVNSGIAVTKTITLTSSNGSTITASVDNAFSVGADSGTSGNLTLEGNLTVTYDKGTIVRMVNGILTVQGNATLTSSWTTVRMATDGGLVATSHVYVKGNATVEATINNEDDYAFYVNGPGKANLHVLGGTVRHTAGYGISFPAGNIEVSGGTVTAKYGIFVWYDANSAAKTLTVSGGTVEGSETGIYFKENTKNCTLTVSGGTVRGNAHAIDYRSNKDSANNSITVSGGTLTAPGSTVFFYRCTAISMGVTGGTIEATTGGNTIYGAELRGNLTLNVSGETTNIIAATVDTIVVTQPGNTSTYPGKLNATITGGKISANDKRTINVQHGAVTISGGEIYANKGFTVFTNKKGAIITITGGRMIAGDNNVIKIDVAATDATLQILGGEMILGGTNELAQIISNDAEASANCTVTVEGGKFLYGENVKTLWDGTDADKTLQDQFDLNGNGEIEEGETFYVYTIKYVRKISFPATNPRFSGEMEKGAAVRIAEGDNGLKFKSVYSAEVVKNLDKKAETGSVIFYGMLIFPTDLLEEMVSFETEDLLALIETAGCTHLVGGIGAQVTTDQDGNVILQGAIVGITDQTVSYSAISYVCLKTGKEMNYYFTAYDTDDNSRTAREIAEAALADSEATYTETQTAILQTYLAAPTPPQLLIFADDTRKKRWI